MRPLWKSWLSWADCRVITSKMNEVHKQMVEALASGKNENHCMFNHDMLSVALIDLKNTIVQIQKKDKKKFHDATK